MIFKTGDLIGGRFEVKKMLGRGALGIVYLVHDQTRGEDVALKVLLPELAKHNLALERFMREVKAKRKVDHQGVVAVFDTGKIGDMLFYTMEYIDGMSISRLIKSGDTKDLKEAIDLMSRICDVIEKVHEVVVHRDLSADNIMIELGGKVRVLDFGTARIIEEASNLTAEGIHIGKICYSAPEQRKDAKSVDHRADLYSLGVLFFEMLTGELIIAYEPVTQYRPDLPAGLDTFFEKALAEDPVDRFASAPEFKAALKSEYA